MLLGLISAINAYNHLLQLPEYDIVHIQPVDQFPHTPHIENIIYLVKK